MKKIFVVFALAWALVGSAAILTTIQAQPAQAAPMQSAR
jgi:hypothetical protein